MIIEVTTGLYSSIAELCTAYDRRGIRHSRWAEDLIWKVSLSSHLEKRYIKILSGKEIGFSEKALSTEIYQKAFSIRLPPITAEMALLLPLAYEQVQRGERILCGMGPIYLTNGDPMIFTVGHAQLGATFALPGQMLWDPSIQWAFESLN